MLSREKGSYNIQSVTHALDFLEALCEEGGIVRVRPFSAKLQMNKMKVYRMLATLESKGYVEKVPGSQEYRLGVSAFEMGQKLLLNMDLLRKAKPTMEHLARQCNEAIYLAVRKGKEVLFLEAVDTTQQIRVMPLVGKCFPLMNTSAGKVIEATNMPHSPELLKILHQGSCIEQGALGDGIACLAVPLYKAEGEANGALCMVGPTFRMTKDVVEKEFLPRLKEAGAVISSKLGYVHNYLGRPNRAIAEKA